MRHAKKCQFLQSHKIYLEQNFRNLTPEPSVGGEILSQQIVKISDQSEQNWMRKKNSGKRLFWHLETIHTLEKSIKICVKFKIVQKTKTSFVDAKIP